MLFSQMVQHGRAHASFRVILLVISLTRPCCTISNSNGSTLLASFGDAESRQRPYPQGGDYEQNPGNNFVAPPDGVPYPGPYPGGVPYPGPYPDGLAYPNPHVPQPFPYPPGALSPVDALGSIRESFVRALESVAFNDELRCVPKLLCEVLAGNAASLSGRQSFLPFKLDMGSLIGMLSQLNLDQASPLLMFGRAALLGYSSQRDPNACSYAYPRCPSDPDRLVQYLNNYNGGFFRYFNGLPGTQTNPPNYYNQLNNDNYYRTYANQYAQQRILSSSNQYAAPSFKSIKFPPNNQDYANNYNAYGGARAPLVFPEGDLNRGVRYRKGKRLFPEPARFERPLPNHVASPLIFPVRTGTGELILDTNSFFPDNQYHDRQKNNYENTVDNRLY